MNFKYSDETDISNRLIHPCRFGRVSCAQKIGFKTREVFHNTDWDKVSKDPSIVGKPLGSWILRHDPEKYAYENYEKCANHILTGAPFENTNSVPGYKFTPWTVKELLDASERGVPVADEGDWYQQLLVSVCV